MRRVAPIETKHRVFGPEHPHVLSSMNGLGMALIAEGELDEAVAIFEELVALANGQYSSTHRKSLLFRSHYGVPRSILIFRPGLTPSTARIQIDWRTRLTALPSAVEPKCFMIGPMACILFLNSEKSMFSWM